MEALNLLNKPLFEISGFNPSVLGLIYIVVLMIVLASLANRIRRALTKALKKKGIYSSDTDALVSLSYYFLMALGAIVVLQSAGLDLSGLTILAGAIGIGIGLGLQGIMNNFVSGLLILFERPIKIGDRIEIAGITGQITRIGMRSSEMITNDNVAMIIPNSEIVSTRVVNWSHTGDIVRLRIPITLSYKTPPEEGIRVLQSAVEQAEGVYRDKVSDVIVDSFGDKGVNYLIRAWTRDMAKSPGRLQNQIYLEVWRILRDHKIEIPYPHYEVDIGAESKSALNYEKQL